MKSLNGFSAQMIRRTWRVVLPVTLSLILCAIVPASLPAQTVGGAIIGLAGSGLVLSESYNANGVTGTKTITFGSSTPGLPNFTFPDGILPNGTSYSVTISSLPSNPGQMCAITGQIGFVGAGTPANSHVVVYCYNISGTVSGLPYGQSINLQNNLESPLMISSDGVFLFPPAVDYAGAINPSANGAYGANYSVTVSGSPYSWGTCSVTHGSGTADANPLQPYNSIQNVWVICQANNVVAPASQWTPLTNLAKDSSGNLFYPGTMLLLPDGSVLVNGPTGNYSEEWLRLIPDSTGSYVNGAWSSVPNSICPHGLFASQVMSNGKVFIAGGEYPGPGNAPSGCTGLVDAEIYDPSVSPAGSWTAANPPANLINPSAKGNNIKGGHALGCPSGTNQGFLDMISETLPDGGVLMAPVCPMNCGDTLVYNPTTGWLANAIPLANTGGANPTGYSCSQQEDTWVKLQDGSILTADPPSPPAQAGNLQTPQTSERFFPSQSHPPGQWSSEASLGFALYDTEYGWSGGGETGPAFLLPSGKAVFIGGSPVMGTYDPIANVWSQTSIAPNGPATGGVLMGGFDSPGAMMADGKILLTLGFAATSYNSEPGPFFFYEYDPTQGAYTEERGPGNSGAPSLWSDCGSTAMLDLPDGTVLAESGCGGNGGANPQLYVYTPNGSPLLQGQPKVQNVTAAGGNCGTCYLLTGTGLNGISEGASYGDDAQMATDFPIVRLKDGSGNIAYARTFNWSTISLVSGASGNTNFQLPAGFGPCDLQLVANGNSSTAFSFTQNCVIPPSEIPICDPKCALGSVAVWSARNNFGDPWQDVWLDGTSLTIPIPDPDAVALAKNLQVSIDTQALMGPDAGRQVLTEGAGHGVSSNSLSLIVGPTIVLKDRVLGSARVGSAHIFTGKLSIPYDSHMLSSRATIRLVTFDDHLGRWIDAGPQSINESKHVVTANISGIGKFAVVADTKRTP
jgi:hypothetical protein